MKLASPAGREIFSPSGRKSTPLPGRLSQALSPSVARSLKDQLISLDIAKRLKELGVKQESFFYYGVEGKGIYFGSITPVYEVGQISAFTVAELGEMLFFGDAYYFSAKLDNCWTILEDGGFDGLFVHNKGIFSIEINEGTEADARGKMIIYLIENGLIKLEDINGI